MWQVEDELVQMLAGALLTLSEANCALVGGHTSEGAEAALGFSVTGVVLPSQAIAKGPLLKDTALILTKPLGESIIFFVFENIINLSAVGASDSVRSAI